MLRKNPLTRMSRSTVITSSGYCEHIWNKYSVFDAPRQTNEQARNREIVSMYFDRSMAIKPYPIAVSNGTGNHILNESVICPTCPYFYKIQNSIILPDTVDGI